MANPHPDTSNLRPHPPWKKGETGNPNGCSKKVRERQAAKNRAEALYGKLLGKKAAKNFYGLTDSEIEYYDNMLLTMNMSELQLLAKADDTPAYAKGYAIAILNDMKQGKTTTLDKLRENLHGKATQRMELTGAGGQPLIQERELTATDVADIMHEYELKYKGGTLADPEAAPSDETAPVPEPQKTTEEA